MLTNLVQEALRNAFMAGPQNIEQISVGTRNARRSSTWVHAFSEALLEHSTTGPLPGRPLVALCRAESANRKELRVNELLFDILVAETTTVRAATKAYDLTALVRAVWVVESELHRHSSREVLVDINKLALAKSVNKVLVVSAGTPIVAWAQSVMKKLLDPAESNVFLVTIPHPDDWVDPPVCAGRVMQLSVEHCWPGELPCVA